MKRLRPIDEYKRLISEGLVTEDAAQARLVEKMSALSDAIVEAEGVKKKSWFGRKKEATAVRGLYIYGDVGRGKSMLMDVFYHNTVIEKRVRIHFNRFMQNFHKRMHELKADERNRDKDLVFMVAGEIGEKYKLICLDEMQIGDVAEALILRRMISWLLGMGVVMVFTSNRAPEELYLDVFQRDKFEELVRLIRDNVDVVKLEAAGDYRLSRLKSITRVYFTPLGDAADVFMDDVFRLLTNGHLPSSGKLMVSGHTLEIPMFYGDVAKFSFADLCEKPYWAGDYAAISKEFNAVMVSDIPKLSATQSNEARRFVAFIDELYEHKVKLVCSAAVRPEELYTEGTASFEFQRTASRLIEMQSEEYLAKSKGS